jgi:hypothetical protein
MSARNLPRCILYALFGAPALLCAGPALTADFAYVVREGDNPWNLTQRFLKNLSYWPRIQQYNRIVEPRRMRPGSRLLIPEAWLRLRAREVRLDAVQGEVFVFGRDGQRRPAVAGERLDPGVRVMTGDVGSAALGFSDGSRVQLRPRSELGVRQSAEFAVGAGTWVRIDLLRGSLESLVVPRSGSASRFEIDTPSAVAMVRGTHFRVHATDSATRNEVIEGRVAFGNAGGEQQVAAGQGASAARGQPVSAPQPLLAAPAPQVLFADRLPAALPFAELDGAVAYRVQIAADGRFDTLLSDLTSSRAAVQVANLQDGDYRVRVRGLDAAGFEGRDGEWPLMLDARPEPPVLVGPAPDARVSDGKPAMSWSRARGDERWRIQLAANERFDRPLVDRAGLDQPAFVPEAELPPGTYYWRIASSNPEEGAGPFSDAQKFRRPEPGPAMEAPEASDDGLSLRWRDAGAGMRYQLQIANADDFAQPQVDVQLSAAQYLMRDPVPGTYLLRVRSFSPDGFEGDWAPVQTITVPEPPPSFHVWWLLPLLLLL